MEKRLRGDASWRGYSNRGKCPKRGTPLWQIVNPLEYDLISEERVVVRKIAWKFLRDEGILRTSEDDIPYVRISNRGEGKKRIYAIRREIYADLPSYITEKLPEANQRKYGLRESCGGGNGKSL